MSLRLAPAAASLLICLAPLFWTGSLRAADYRAEVLNAPAPAGEVADEIRAELSETGIRVIRGSKTEYCDIWLRKELAVLDNFEPSSSLLYPFSPGQLVGVMQFARKGTDFRDQEIEDGVYTLRYAQQPVDGAHVGTSLTRDFLLLLRADQDESLEMIEYDPLTQASAEAAGTSHPALLALKEPLPAGEEASLIRHNDEHDWWIVAFQAKTTSGKTLPVDLVVVGLGAE